MYTLTMNPLRTRLASFVAATVLLAVPAALTGCSGALGGSSPVGVKYTGNVHGGQQPVNGATIQLWAVGTTGNKSQSTAMISETVKTDSNGYFSITGKYDCSTLPATQVYITAVGGDSGSGGNNHLSLMTALGPCSSLTPSTFIQINELTTVAAAYALAPFASDYSHIGSTGPNPTGLVNAFANASNLVNFATGQMPGSTLPAGATEPVQEINTLADILATCVNTNGDTTAGHTCYTLFQATGATETIGAALGIVANPSAAAVTAMWNMPTGDAPFQPTLTAQPKDFTVAVNYNANGGFYAPYGIAIDAWGNAWVTNEAGVSIVELDPNGAVKTTRTAAGLIGPQGIAVDPSGNVWVANTAGNSVVKFTVTGGVVQSSNSYTGVNGPTALAIDGGGAVFAANFNGNSVTLLNPAGAVVGTYTGNGNISLPTSLALDASRNVYVTTGGLNGSVVKLDSSGAYTSTLTDSALQGPQSVAVSATGNVIVTGFTTGATRHGAVSVFGGGGSTVSGFSPIETGLIDPSGIALDPTSAWIVNRSTDSGGLTKLPLGSATASSPDGGYGSLNAPVGVAVDASGSVWTTNLGTNTVSKFVGLATPVVVPIAARLPVPM